MNIKDSYGNGTFKELEGGLDWSTKSDDLRKLQHWPKFLATCNKYLYCTLQC